MFLLKRIEKVFFELFHSAGGMLITFFQCLVDVKSLVTGGKRLLRQLLQVGLKTLPLAAMIGLFTGMITALQTGAELKKLGLETQVGTIVGLSLVREMGPVFTAFIVAARVGAAWAAEIGAMKVSEEIDALRSLGIRPLSYLAVPRFYSSLAMQPALTVYSIIIGMWGGALVSVNYLGVSSQIYYDRMYDALELKDVGLGLFKALIFGVIISIVSCYAGLHTDNGPRGVGKATTKSVVISLSLILIADYFITRFLG